MRPHIALLPLAPIFLTAALVAAAPAHAARPDLSPYIGNTIACGAGIDGHDLCHTWLYPNGRMINFDQMGGHPGHYTLSPLRADGTFSICYFYDSALIPVPAALLAPPPGAKAQGQPMGQPPGLPPGMHIKTTCTTTDFRSVCARTPVPASEPVDPINIGMGKRFHDGLCYPMPAHATPGTQWVATNDPLPSQGGKDVVLLLQGRR